MSVKMCASNLTRSLYEMFHFLLVWLLQLLQTLHKSSWTGLWWEEDKIWQLQMDKE